MATYVNDSTAYYNMEFITYKPSDAINTLGNPLMGILRLNYESVQLNLILTTGQVMNLRHAQILTSPAPVGCWWDVR